MWMLQSLWLGDLNICHPIFPIFKQIHVTSLIVTIYCHRYTRTFNFILHREKVLLQKPLALSCLSFIWHSKKILLQIRPLLPKEKLAGEQSCVRIIPSSNQLVLGKDRAFTFDYILSSKTTQVSISLNVYLCSLPEIRRTVRQIQ